MCFIIFHNALYKMFALKKKNYFIWKLNSLNRLCRSRNFKYLAYFLEHRNGVLGFGFILKTSCTQFPL